MTRWALPLAIVVVAILGYFVLSGDDSGRSARRGNAEGEGVERTGVTDDPGTADASSGAAMKKRIADLIAKHGGFVSTGRVDLTDPLAPGVGLDVTMTADIDGPVTVRGKTDTTGKFAMPQLPRTGEYTLRIESARTQTYTREGIIAPAAEDTLDLGEIVVARYYFVTGRILTDGRTGVSEAVVELTDPPSGNAFSFMRAAQETDKEDPVLAQAVAGPDGSYSLKVKKPGIFMLRTTAKGWANNYKSDLVVGGATDVRADVILSRGYPVVGYVLDAAGRPAQASVTLYASGWSMSAWPKQVRKTDGDGRFEFQVEPGARRYTLSVVPQNGINLSRNFQIPLNEDLILRMPGTGSVKGRVVDALTGQALAKADVLVAIGRGRGMPEFSKSLRTDEFGVFKVGGIGTGQLQSVMVRIDGYADLRATGWGATDAEVWDRIRTMELSADSEVDLGEFPMAKGKILFGVVRDKESGDPIAGADVQLWDFVMGNRSTRSDDSGSYRFVGVSDRIALIVERDGYASMRDRPFPGFQLDSERQEVRRDVELESGGTITGTVKDENGKPLAGVLVRLQSAQTGWQAMMSGLSLRDSWSHTDEKGNYRIDGVPPMSLKVQASAEGYDDTSTSNRTVKAGEVMENVHIKMLLAASLEGVIRSRAGGTVEAARITIARDPGDKANDGARWAALGAGTTSFSGQSGRFEVRNVPVGKIMIRVEKSGFATTTFRREVKPGERVTDFTLDLPQAFQIRGKVRNADGQAVGNCWIRAKHTASPDGDPIDQLVGARVGSNGEFTIDALPAGTYEIEVRFGNWGGANRIRYQNVTRGGVSAGTTDLVIEAVRAEE